MPSVYILSNIVPLIRKACQFLSLGLSALRTGPELVTGTPIPLDTHPPEHSSPWNTHPTGTLIPLEHSFPWNSHPPGTLIPPGTPIPLEHPSPHGTLIPLSYYLIIYTH